MSDSLQTCIDLIRHGEPVGGRRYRGHIDDPLNEKGWQQMQNAVASFASWQHIITSTLLRCAQFAESLGRQLKIPVSKDERLKEISWGDWEGHTPSELEEKYPGALRRFWNDPLNNIPPGGESLHVFHARVMSAWREITARHRNSHILIVAHAGIIRSVIADVLEMPIANMYRIDVANASISRILIETDSANVTHAKLKFHGGKLS